MTGFQTGELNWYAIRVSANREVYAQRLLSRLGVWVFLPKVERWRRANRFQRSKKLVEYPLLARYIFVGMTAQSKGWQALFNTGYIRGVVCANGRPYRFEDAVIQELNRRAERGDFRAPRREATMRSRLEFAEGDDVFVAEGPFEGHRVRVEKIVGVHAAVKFDLLGGPRLVDVPLDALERAA